MTITKKVSIAIATGSLLLNALSPVAFADTTLMVTGNGSNSDSAVNVTADHSTTVVQNNKMSVSNDVQSTADSGDNKGSDNTGGNTTIHTGDATSIDKVVTKGNTNAADVQCACDNGDTNVLISGNGTKSDNNANLTSNTDTQVFQNNKAEVANNIDNTAKSGHNTTDDNTGGNVTVETGNATADTHLMTDVNHNVANVGTNGGTGSTTNLVINGNGSNTDNSISLDMSHSTTLDQSNDAYVTNNADTKAASGDNQSDDNTGGDVTTHTGDATAIVKVDTEANFNAADIQCDCTMNDVLAKEAGNGTGSDNQLSADLGGDTQVFQGGETGNALYVDNNANAKAKTGRNGSKDNTGTVVGDAVLIHTGDAAQETQVTTNGNSNVFGPSADLQLGNLDLNMTFSLADLLGALHLSL